jgi:uncharacterized membrane protein
MIAVLLASALYPVLAIPARLSDRMVPTAPRGLDGIAYMATARHSEQDRSLDLREDWRAIRWLQQHVHGTPVIVEAQVPEYRWGSRISIYTGLPAVIGWNWHQRQQRAAVSDQVVWQRVSEVETFYNTTDLEEAEVFLRRYRVRWIVVGGLERAYYSPEGIAKFDALEGLLWREAWREGETALYEVRVPGSEAAIPGRTR